MASNSTLNFLSSGSSRFVIHNAPKTTLTITDISIPGLELPPFETPNPYPVMYTPGDTLIYNPLVVTFAIGEKLENWIEIYEWMVSIAPPEDKMVQFDDSNQLVDCEALFYTEQNNPLLGIKYIDCTPISLGNVDLTEEDPEWVIKKSTLELRFRRFEIRSIA